MKSVSQITREMDALYQAGWRGHVFICDDNFVGNRKAAREAVLPELIDWMRIHNYPFTFSAAVSIDLAYHPEIMDMMTVANFGRVTIGIESPNIESLKETNKRHNIGHDLLEAVKTIQRHGLKVQAGFIIGFDHDSPDIFDEQFQFIQESGIATAMVSMLYAFPSSRLYNRLNHENRLLPIQIADTAYGLINFEPHLGIDRIR